MQDALISNRFRRRWLWLAISWLMVILVVVLSLAPISSPIPVGRADLLAHMCAYFVLMCWFAALYPRRAHLWISLSLVTLGVALEIAQHELGYRSFEAADIAANTIGAVAGFFWGGALVAAMLERVEQGMDRVWGEPRPVRDPLLR